MAEPIQPLARQFEHVEVFGINDPFVWDHQPPYRYYDGLCHDHAVADGRARLTMTTVISPQRRGCVPAVHSTTSSAVAEPATPPHRRRVIQSPPFAAPHQRSANPEPKDQ